jgi:hypothetical protein
MLTFDDMRDVLTDKDFAKLVFLTRNSPAARKTMAPNYADLLQAVWIALPYEQRTNSAFWGKVYDRLKILQ